MKKTKSCRICRYYELDENFCAVAPDYIGKAHLCDDFELAIELDEEEEPIDLRRFIYEQFSKDYLEKLLSPYGKIEVERTFTISPRRDIDLWFAPSVSELPKELGLLARLAKTRVLFEPYHHPVTSDEITASMIKLLEVQGEFHRAAERETLQWNESDLPWLWILTPTISEETLTGFGAEESTEEETGIYFLPPAMLTGLVVIDELPHNNKTLWLRLLGREKVRHQALLELVALPAHHSLRSVSLGLLYNFLAQLEALPEKNDEERLLRELLVPLRGIKN
ncbi:MAG: hypothetical protein F6K14_03055 [Symploca sp. SIO2C1]|nr:hypothetical protein [Symploca sp. SIO2C1]